MTTVTVEIEFEGEINSTKLVPEIISNRDAVQLLGANIKEIRIVAVRW